MAASSSTSFLSWPFSPRHLQRAIWRTRGQGPQAEMPPWPYKSESTTLKANFKARKMAERVAPVDLDRALAAWLGLPPIEELRARAQESRRGQKGRKKQAGESE